MSNVLSLPGLNNSFYKRNSNNELPPNILFVAGSNLSGFHGAGAAKTANQNFGAVYYQSTGRSGKSYLIPTKGAMVNGYLPILSLEQIKGYVDDFIQYTLNNPDLAFYVTPIGTGLAGYKHQQIAPMFKGAINCWFSEDWEMYLR